MASNVKSLHEYLRNVLDIESNLYVLRKLSGGLRYKLNSLEVLKAPEKPSTPEAPNPENSVDLLGLVIFLVIFGVAGLIITYMICKYSIRLAINKLFVGLYGVMISLSFMGGGMAGALEESDKNKKSAQMYEAKKRKYISDMIKYQNAVTATQKENAKRQAERAVLQANIDAAEKQFTTSLLTLDKLYSANIIHPKYRDLTAVSSLYEYIDTGRCSQLEGPNGAYNMFESEVRLDHILLKMDDVIRQLDSIRQSQYQLYVAVSEGNRRTASLLESVSQDVKSVSASGGEAAKQLSNISASEKVIAYNTERTRKELEYYNRMRYRLGDYDKVWDNRLP